MWLIQTSTISQAIVILCLQTLEMAAIGTLDLMGLIGITIKEQVGSIVIVIHDTTEVKDTKIADYTVREYNWKSEPC